MSLLLIFFIFFNSIFIGLKLAHSLIEFDNSTNEVRKLSTVNGLSEVGISCIVSNLSHQALVVAYNSSNLDIIKNDRIINLSSILNSTITGDKTINNLYSNNKYVYGLDTNKNAWRRPINGSGKWEKFGNPANWQFYWINAS